MKSQISSSLSRPLSGFSAEKRFFLTHATNSEFCLTVEGCCKLHYARLSKNWLRVFAEMVHLFAVWGVKKNREVVIVRSSLSLRFPLLRYSGC